jgi:hypothetical protein
LSNEAQSKPRSGTAAKATISNGLRPSAVARVTRSAIGIVANCVMMMAAEAACSGAECDVTPYSAAKG